MTDSKTVANANESPNPLLQNWQNPYGLPTFELIKPEHFRPAFVVLFEEHLTKIDALANDSVAPTFENTVAVFDAANPARTDSQR
jgi:peptidyl-dipeptidase Dcp